MKPTPDPGVRRGHLRGRGAGLYALGSRSPGAWKKPTPGLRSDTCARERSCCLTRRAPRPGEGADHPRRQAARSLWDRLRRVRRHRRLRLGDQRHEPAGDRRRRVSTANDHGRIAEPREGPRSGAVGPRSFHRRRARRTELVVTIPGYPNDPGCSTSATSTSRAFRPPSGRAGHAKNFAHLGSADAAQLPMTPTRQPPVTQWATPASCTRTAGDRPRGAVEVVHAKERRDLARIDRAAGRTQV